MPRFRVRVRVPRILVLPTLVDMNSAVMNHHIISSTMTTNNKASHVERNNLATFGGKNILTKDRHHEVTPELLSRKWGCGLLTAKKTLKHTTQFGIRSAIGPLTRRYRTDLVQLHHRRLNVTFYTDTFFSKTKSLKGYTCCQIFTDGKGFIHSIPMRSKKEAGKALRQIIQDFGIPRKMIYDGSKEQCEPGSEFQKALTKYHIEEQRSEPHTPNQNRAEDSIREVKRRWKRRIMKRRVPKRVWDFAITWESEILSRMCRHSNDFTGIERLTGDTVDISEWLDF